MSLLYIQAGSKRAPQDSGDDKTGKPQRACEIDKDEDGYQYIKCNTCGFVSYNKNDIVQKYCGCCKQYHQDQWWIYQRG